jgi:hypothetical protein
MNKLKTALIQLHKISGSFISLLFLVWFLTGIVLIFAGFPHASRQERFEHLIPFNSYDFENIQAFPPTKGKVELEKYLDKPVYRVYFGRRAQKVYDATTLESIKSFSEDDAIVIAERFRQHPVSKIELVEELDSWIPWSYYKPLLPFYKCYVDDAAHTVLYVSSKSGAIIQETNRDSRWLARVGAIPHWIYFKQLKSNDELWKTIVVVLGIIGLLACVSGFWVAFYRVKKDENNRTVKLTVYKKWDYKWHHLMGWFLAVLMSTFTLSGIFYTTNIPSWLSAKPEGRSYLSKWNKVQVNDSLMHPSIAWKQLPNKNKLRKLAPSSSLNKQVINAYYDDYRNPQSYCIINNDSLVPFTFTETDLINYAQGIFKHDSFELKLQTSYDDYYRESGMFHHPLPAYKIIVNDEYNTQLYIDGNTGKAVTHIDNNKQWRRWLTKALHKFDFPFLANYDWLRKILLIIAMLAGSFMCITSVTLSWKWLKRVIKTENRRRRTEDRRRMTEDGPSQTEEDEQYR